LESGSRPGGRRPTTDPDFATGQLLNTVLRPKTSEYGNKYIGRIYISLSRLSNVT